MFLSVASKECLRVVKVWKCSEILAFQGSVAVETIFASPTDPGTETLLIFG
jgi:hypothetical protein